MTKCFKKALSLVCALSLLVTGMAAGVSFGASAATGEYLNFFTYAFNDHYDAYVALSEPLSAAPTTFEATVNMRPYASEWAIDSFLNERYAESTELKTAAAGDGTGLAAGEKYLEKAMTSGGFVHPIGSWNGSFTPPAVSVPFTDTLALSFKLWFSEDMSYVETQVDLSSNESTNGALMRQHLALSNVKAGWTEVIMPFKDFPGYSDEAIRATRVNFFRLWNWHTSAVGEVDYTLRFAEMKVVDLADQDDLSAVTSSATALETDVTLDSEDFAVFTNYQGNWDYSNVYGLYVLKEGYPALVYAGRQYTFNTNVRTNKDTHMSVVHDGDVFTLYVDGKKVQSTGTVTAEAPVITSVHTIAANADDSCLMLGQIGNVRVWDDVRTANEIDVYKAYSSLKADDQGLVGAWDLRGNITHILEELPDLKGENPIVFRGTRRDQWIDYEVPGEIGDDYYTMVWIPDPQNITIWKARDIWYEDMQWIADNIESENIVHVMSAGDNTWSNDHETWGRVVEGFEKFWNDVSWSSCAGNHDYVWSAPERDTRNYNQYLGLDVINATAAKDSFKGWYNEGEDAYTTYASGVENSYYEVKVGNTKWLILQLEMYPRLSVLNWAESIVKKYPNHQVMITTHSQLGTKGVYNQDSYAYFAEEKENGDFTESMEVLYSKLVEPYSNVKMVLSGHHDNPDGERAVLSRNYQREDGSVVYQMMINAQYLDTDDKTNYHYYNDQCVGMLGLFRFSADGSRVAFDWFNPSTGKSYDPYPNGDNPAVTMGECYMSQSSFVLPFTQDAYETILLGEKIKKYPDLTAVASVLDDEAFSEYYIAMANAKELLNNSSVTTEEAAAAGNALDEAYKNLFAASDIGYVDFSSGEAVYDKGGLVASATLDDNNKGVEIKAFENGYALFCGTQGEHNYVTLDLSKFVEDVTSEVHVKVTYRTANGTDPVWTTIVAGRSFAKNDNANYTYIGNTTNVMNHMGTLPVNKWAQVSFDFKDLSTATYGKKLVLGGNPMSGIYITKIEVMTKEAGAAVDKFNEAIAEAEEKLATKGNMVLKTALDTALFVKENLAQTDAIKVTGDKLAAAVEAVELANKSALITAIDRATTKVEGKTAASTAEYLLAVADAYSALGDATLSAEDVQAAVAALENAAEKLQNRSDYKALDEKLAEEENRKLGLFVYDSMVRYQELLAGLKALRRDINATEEDVAAAIEAFDAEVAGLARVNVDKSGLQSEVDKAPANLLGYTPETATPYKEALDIAKEILASDNYTQTEVDQAHRELMFARIKLVLLPLDKTELQAMVDDARTDLHRYEKELADAYTAALETAKAVLASDTVTQSDVMAALEALKAADAALVFDTMPGDVNGDGKVDSTDARLTLQYFVGAVSEADLDLVAANVDGNDKVDSTDARLILQFFVGAITEFPAGE